MLDRKNLHVLAIDDDSADIEMLRHALSQVSEWRIALTACGQWRAAGGVLSVNPDIELIFMDERVGGTPGREVMQRLRESGDSRPVIVLAGCGRRDGAAEMLREGAYDYLVKGSLDIGLLERTIRNALARYRLTTEKERLEKELRQAQKMESLGALAGGIAHDFNNILMPILGYSEMAVDLVPEGSRAREYLEEIAVAANRAKDLVQQILTFSRQSENARQPVKIQPIVKEAFKLLRSTVPVSITMRQSIDPDCRAVIGDLSQIYQVVMNLGTNAYQAMKGERGVIEIRLKERFADEEMHKKLRLPRAGCYNLLSISDSGGGIPPELQERIFEPFFTTKPSGTGMGLSVVQSIVKSHGGRILVHSSPGEGCRFEIYLPVHESGDKAVEEGDRHCPTPTTGVEHILLLDDDVTVNRVNYRLLKSLGYSLTVFTDSTQALVFFREDPWKFDLIISDVSMPAMSGLTFSEAVRNLNPDVPIILYTGYQDPLVEKKARKLGIKRVIIKPLVKKDLAAVIRDALDGPSLPLSKGAR